jgi:hypothetical protein
MKELIIESNSNAGPVSSLLGQKGFGKSAMLRKEKQFPHVDSPFEAFHKELMKRRKVIDDREKVAEEKSTTRKKSISQLDNRTNADGACEEKSATTNIENEVINANHVATMKREAASGWISNPRLSVKERISQTNEWASINANNPVASASASFVHSNDTVENSIASPSFLPPNGTAENSIAYTTIELPPLVESSPYVDDLVSEFTSTTIPENTTVATNTNGVSNVDDSSLASKSVLFDALIAPNTIIPTSVDSLSSSPVVNASESENSLPLSDATKPSDSKWPLRQ